MLTSSFQHILLHLLSYFLNKCCFGVCLFLLFINQRILKKYHRFPTLIINQNCIKCNLKYIKKIEQIYAGLMTISDFLQKYKIVMYPNF